VEDFLDQVMQTEFDLLVEDGSLGEVASLLVEYHASCSSPFLSQADLLARQGSKF
jgi:hypothetical protein